MLRNIVNSIAAGLLLGGTLMMAQSPAQATGASRTGTPEIVAASTARESCIEQCEARRDYCLETGGYYSTCVSMFMSCKRRCESTYPATAVSGLQERACSSRATSADAANGLPSVPLLRQQ